MKKEALQLEVENGNFTSIFRRKWKEKQKMKQNYFYAIIIVVEMIAEKRDNVVYQNKYFILTFKIDPVVFRASKK